MIGLNLALTQVRQQIAAAERQYNRTPGSVKLLAVSKQQSIEKIQTVIAANQILFGENYLQEALTKIAALKNTQIEWHFIGHIQSNKTRAIAENFAWVHSVDRLQIAKRLNKQRPTHLPPLNICLEINIDKEPQKAGIYPENTFEVAKAIKQLPNLKLRGLMCIPQPRKSFEEQRKPFQELKKNFEKLQQQDFKELDTLSMGMTHDFTAAIAEGATIVRIGTAIFGERKFTLCVDDAYQRKNLD